MPYLIAQGKPKLQFTSKVLHKIIFECECDVLGEKYSQITPSSVGNLGQAYNQGSLCSYLPMASIYFYDSATYSTAQHFNPEILPIKQSKRTSDFNFKWKCGVKYRCNCVPLLWCQVWHCYEIV